jgi:hypothetical protein
MSASGRSAALACEMTNVERLMTSVKVFVGWALPTITFSDLTFERRSCSWLFGGQSPPYKSIDFYFDRRRRQTGLVVARLAFDGCFQEAV